jgi:hypothetical protein
LGRAQVTNKALWFWGISRPTWFAAGIGSRGYLIGIGTGGVRRKGKATSSTVDVTACLYHIGSLR